MEIIERLSGMEIGDAIALLKGSYADFCAAINATLERTPRLAIIPADDTEEEATICRKAHELRHLGFTRVEALVDDRTSLNIARNFSKALRHRADFLGVKGELVHDTQLNGSFWGRHVSGFNTRIGFNAQNVNESVKPIMDGATLGERIIKQAIGIPGIAIKKNLFIVDNLQPTDTLDFQWWHFDRLYEQYKVLIFLDDVHGRNGPMRVLPGTHVFEGSRRIYDFCNYSEPHHGADPGYNVIKNRLPDIVCAEGKAGDAFIFDTKIFHAHGRPLAAERNTACIYYQPPATPLNLFYQKYQPSAQCWNY